MGGASGLGWAHIVSVVSCGFGRKSVDLGQALSHVQWALGLCLMLQKSSLGLVPGYPGHILILWQWYEREGGR